MRKTTYIYSLAAALMLVGMASCNRDSGPDDPVMKGPVDVRVLVSDAGATRSVGSEDTDNVIRQLRVYAFNDNGVLAGYNEATNLDGRTYIPMTLSQGGSLYFYVVANDNFGEGPTTDGASVTDWSSLTPARLRSLTFTGWQVVDGECISPMSNNRYKEDGTELEYVKDVNDVNDYATPVEVTSNNQIIPVTVQHVLGRLRLFLNKDASASENTTITLTRAAVYNRPDGFRLYNGGSDEIPYTSTDTEPRVDVFYDDDQTGIELTTYASDYTQLAPRTFLMPNRYGSSDPNSYVADSESYDDADKAYRLDLTVVFSYSGGTSETKVFQVYLPPVSRNASIDVKGTFVGSASVTPEFNVMTNAWVGKDITIPPFE